MNWDQIEGQWKTLKGQIRTKWGKLTDQDVTTMAGKKDMLLGKIQERYGIQKDEAERQVDDWVKNMNSDLEQPKGGAAQPAHRSY